MSEIDPNKILATAAASIAKDIISSAKSAIVNKLTGSYTKYFESFTPYLEKTYITCSLVKTIINKESPVIIEDIYVKSKFQCEKETVGDDSLCQHVRDNRRIVVTGFGGIGKTIFCKYLFRSIFTNPGGKIPVFFELRKINEIKDKNLSAYIRISLTAEDHIIPEDIFRSMMLDGRFVFILDGFDEIPDEFKYDIQRQIIEMSHNYRNCGFVVSSRFDDRFASWQEFHVFRALPFERDQTHAVITKAKFDKDTKKEFLTNIFEKKYEKYKGFFSTPLLTLMMLMTYLQIKHIPDNVHIFYRYAFQTLFTLHDASKEGFQRKRRLTLSEQEFMEIFSMFCLSSYSEMEHTFSEPRCLHYIERARKRAGKEFSDKDFLLDATDAVNMLFKDGDQYTFIHRSFQEYFSAYAVTHYFVKSIRDVSRRLPRRTSDSVFSMMREMNTAVVDEFYLLPEHTAFDVQLSRLAKETDPVEILNLVGITIEFGFQVEGRRLTPFFYSDTGSSDFNVFIEIAYMMLKDRAPKELNGSGNKRGIMPSFRGLQRILKSKIPSREGDALDVEINFDQKCILGKVRHFGSDSSNVTMEEVKLPLIDVNWAKEIPVILELSQSVKSRGVFVKRTIEEIKRNHKRAREGSDDILSL